MSCATTKLSALLFCVPHKKPHGVKGLSKHYHLRPDPKLVHGKNIARDSPNSDRICLNS